MARYPQAAGSDASFTYTQGSASATWTITHGLGKHPAVAIVDSAGDEVVGDVEHVSTNQVIARFSAPFAGKAFLN